MEHEQDMLEAVKQGNVTRISELLEMYPALIDIRAPGGESAVLLAVYHGQSKVVRLLRERGKRLDLFEASAVGQADRVEELLDQHPEQLDALSPDGFTPLALAAFFGHEAVVDLLLDKGADPAIASSNAMRVMPIHAAAATQQLDIARTLLARGSPADAAQADDFTPLHAAAQNGQLEMVKLLIEHGADVNARKADGQTALDLAIQHSHPEVAEYLQQYGARE